jgi:hypothetical protein
MPCPDCDAPVPLREMKRHQREKCPRRGVPCPNPGCGVIVEQRALVEHLRKDCRRVGARDEMAEKRKARFGPGTCPQCTQPVLMERLKYHLEHECPLRMVECPLFGCGMKVPLGDLAFHRGELRVPCFMCKKPTPGGNSRFLYRSNGPLKTVLVTSHDPIPKDTVKALDQIVSLWKKHPKLRRRVLKSFQRDHRDVFELDEVFPLFDLSESMMKAMDQCEVQMLQLRTDLKNCNHSVLATDAEKEHKAKVQAALDKCMAGRWAARFEKIEALSKDMAVCAKVGKRGKVVVTEITCCEKCIHDPNMIPPLTDISQYRSNAVCPVLFRREMMILQREEASEQVDCPRGCGKRVRRRDVQRHLKSECGLRTVKCEWPECGLRYVWRQRSVHRQTCAHYVARETMSVKRLIRLEEKSCSWCGEFKGAAREVQTHERSECPWRFIPCQNEPSCGEYVLAKDQPLHNLICQGKRMKRDRAMSDRSWMRRIAEAEKKGGAKELEWLFGRKLRQRAFAEEKLGGGGGEGGEG